MKKQIKCDFTSVNLQLEQRTISCKISRDSIDLETADEIFAGHRLTGTVEVIRDDEADGQAKLFEDDLPSVTASFDVKKFAVSPEEVSCTLIFAKDDIDPATLDRFQKRSGRITVTKFEEIPEKDSEE